MALRDLSAASSSEFKKFKSIADLFLDIPVSVNPEHSLKYSTAKPRTTKRKKKQRKNWEEGKKANWSKGRKKRG